MPLFWLDAHWCVASDTAGRKSQCPLLMELDSIGSLGKNSVVLIDDARLFLATPPIPHEVSDWPTLNEILEKIQQIGPNHKLIVVNDVIIFFPEVISYNIYEYARVHGVDWLRAAQAHQELVFLDNLKKELVERLSTIDTLNTLLKRRDALHKESINENNILIQEIDNLKLELNGQFSILKTLKKLLSLLKKN